MCARFCDCFKNRVKEEEDPVAALLRARKEAKEAGLAWQKTLAVEEERRQEDREMEERSFEMVAARGVDFIKHGREGAPHRRKVCLFHDPTLTISSGSGSISLIKCQVSVTFTISNGDGSVTFTISGGRKWFHYSASHA